MSHSGDVKHVKWACPRCDTGIDDRHGRGGAEACEWDPSSEHCYGFICECDDDLNSCEDDHGEHVGNPCRVAHCYHCGWGGTFPVPTFKLKGWAKKAWDAGWRPPKGWTPDE